MEGRAASLSEPVLGEERWSLVQRVGFRFFFVYFVLYVLPFPCGYVLWADKPAEWYEGFWYAVVPWVGRVVLGLDRDIPVGPNGSGDTTADYVRVFCLAVLAALATLVWSLVARRRAHPRLAALLRLLLRYVLGATMLSYGFAKVFKSQFSFPDPARLMGTYGGSSPMGLLWTFMGFSTPYTVFSGLGEVVGGALLFFRRTTTLGALILTGVLANVVILNFAYDVPVKLYSSHLLTMTLVLLWPDARRLLDFLVLNRRVEPTALVPILRGGSRYLLLAVKLLFIGLITYSTASGAYEGYRTWGDGAPRSKLYGLYDVEEFVRVAPSPGGLAGPAEPSDVESSADSTRWLRLGVGKWICTVLQTDGEHVGYRQVYDEAAGTLSLTAFSGTPTHVFTVNWLEPGLLELAGTLDGAEVALTLRQVDLTTLPLVGRGFHWINEFPLNR